MLDALLALLENLEAFAPRIEVALAGIQRAGIAFGLEGVHFALQFRRFRLGILQQAGNIFVLLRRQEIIQRLLDAEQAQEGPH